jgi:HTH-type transcriptional regulator/antitoxin MqsA
MFGNSSICPVCGAGELTAKTIDERFTYKGQEMTVPDYVIYECAECGEALVEPASAKKAEKLLKDFSRQVDGLLRAADIKRIRKKLGFTQEQMAEVCGGGLKGFARYESGQVIQSKGMDNLLRILDEFPFVLDIINRRPEKKPEKIVSILDYRRSEAYRYTEQPYEVTCSEKTKFALG